MKLLRNFLLSAVILAASLAQAAAAPLAKLSVRSYGDLTNIITRFAANLDPSAKTDYAQEFSKKLGLTNQAAFDVKRSWEIVVWYDGGTNQPLLAIKAPVGNVTRFKDSLNSEGLLRTHVREWSQLENGLSLITFREAGTLTESEQSALNRWKTEVIQPPTRMIELTVILNEPLRKQLVSTIAFGKMAISQAMSSQQSVAASGLNPKAMTEMFSLYFEVIETYLAGFQELKLGLDIGADALTLDKVVTAKPDTELAKWLQKPAGQLTAQDLNGIDPESLASFAAHMGNEPSLMKIAQKLTSLGIQMQTMGTNETMAKEVEAMFTKMFPMTFTGSAYLKDQFAFAGAYRFPASSMAEVYAQMKHLMSNSVQTQVGEGKMYSAATLTEKHQVINGIPVDRFSLTINPESPLFKMPGQKEQLKLFWPNGKMEIDYAIKDGQMLVASAGRIKGLLESSSGKSNAKSAFKLEDATCLAGYLNLIGLIKQIAPANPLMPGPVKEKMLQLDPQGTSLEFQVSINKQMHAVLRVPMKLFREFGRLQNN